MEFVHEYALLLVVAIPIAVVAGMNLFLWLGGERETLLLPGPGRFPPVLEPADAAPQPAAVEANEALALGDIGPPANDERVEEAA